MDKTRLWAAADKLRPYIDAGHNRETIFDMLFLKSVSERDWVPEDATWEHLLAICRKSEGDDITILFNSALKTIQNSNKDYFGLFREYSSEEIPSIIFCEVLELCDAMDGEIEFGALYEYYSQKGFNDGKKAGQYFTPKSVVSLLVKLLKPYSGTVYDPCCGTGGMFVHTAQEMQNLSLDISKVNFTGQESNPRTWRMAKKDLLLKSLKHNIGDRAEDTILNPVHKILHAEYSLANPPFNMSDWGRFKIEKSKGSDIILPKVPLPSDSSANYVWLLHILSRLKEDGRAAVLLANGSLDVTNGGQNEIRRKFIELGFVESIVSLPGELFYSTTIPAAIWILHKSTPNRDGGILFINGSECQGEMIKRGLRKLTEVEIDAMAETYNTWRDSGEVIGEANSIRASFVKYDTILTGPNDLNPGRYSIKSPAEILGDTTWNHDFQQAQLASSIAEVSAALTTLQLSLSDIGFNSVKETTSTKILNVVDPYNETINPMKYPEEEFDLYSIPSFDESGLPEVTKGGDIGSNKLLIRKISILVSRLNPRTPRIWIARPTERRAICSTEFSVLEVKDEALFSWLFISLHSQVATTYLKSVARGTTGSRKRVRQSDLMNLELPLSSTGLSPISPAVEQLVPLKESLVNGLKLLDEIIPDAADDMFRMLQSDK